MVVFLFVITWYTYYGEDMENSNKKVKSIIKWVLIVLSVIVVLWFSFTMCEYYRVRIEKRPIVCFHEVTDTENINEYSKTCYGLLYKYREYYKISDDEMTAREFTLFFKEFNRKLDNK